MCFYCHSEANRVVMTPHLPQAAVGRKEKTHCEVPHWAQSCPWARVQLTDKASDRDTLLWVDNRNYNYLKKYLLLPLLLPLCLLVFIPLFNPFLLSLVFKFRKSRLEELTERNTHYSGVCVKYCSDFLSQTSLAALSFMDDHFSLNHPP